MKIFDGLYSLNGKVGQFGLGYGFESRYNPEKLFWFPFNKRKTLILLLITVIIVIIGIICFFYFKGEDDKQMAIISLSVCLFISLVITVFASIRIVDAGHRGVMIHMGSVDDTVLGEGLYLVTPFFTTVEEIEVRTQKSEFKADAASSDLQQVTTSVALNYHVNPQVVAHLFQTVGLEYRERIIDPQIHEAFKAATARYKAEELIQKRPEVKKAIEDMLSDVLKSYGLTVENVSITDFKFSPDFDRAVEAKQVKEQEAKQQQYLLDKAKLQKQTEITLAEGSAEASRITAEALRAAGGSLVIAQAWIAKWDGHLPKLVASDNGGMMLDVSTLMSETNSNSYSVPKYPEFPR